MAQRKLFPLVFAATSAGALFLAGLLGEALGDELKQFFAPVLPHWKWLMGGGLAVTILSALWDRWHADAPDDTAAPHRNVTIREATESTVITGDGNQVQQVKGDAVRGNKTEIHHHHLAPEIRPLSVVANALPLRQPKADFTGREDILQKIRTDRGGKVAISAGVQGMGGVGKTELALRLADEWKADYPDAQLMIDLHGYDQDFVTTERALEMVIRAFHPEAGQLPY